MKIKIIITCVCCFLIGIFSSFVFLSKYYSYSGSGTIHIKEFPRWFSTVEYKYKGSTVSISELGCVIKCDKTEYGTLEGVPEDGGFWFIYSGSGSTFINEALHESRWLFLQRLIS